MGGRWAARFDLDSSLVSGGVAAQSDETGQGKHQDETGSDDKRVHRGNSLFLRRRSVTLWLFGQNQSAITDVSATSSM